MNETTTQNNQHRKRNSNRPRTIRWYADHNVGEDHSPTVAVARFFITIAPDESPELFMIPMLRQFVYDASGKAVGMKPQYAGDIERNAVPLSGLDIEKLYTAMTRMKTDMLRKQKLWGSLERPFVPPPGPRFADNLREKLGRHTAGHFQRVDGAAVLHVVFKQAARERLGDWK